MSIVNIIEITFQMKSCSFCAIAIAQSSFVNDLFNWISMSNQNMKFLISKISKKKFFRESNKIFTGLTDFPTMLSHTQPSISKS